MKALIYYSGKRAQEKFEITNKGEIKDYQL